MAAMEKVINNFQEPSPKASSDIINWEKGLINELASLPKSKHKDWALSSARAKFGDTLPEFMIDIIAGRFIDGDTGLNADVKPTWLDMEKFRRGQNFAMDYHVNVIYSELLASLPTLLFKNVMNPLVESGRTATPYASFTRYVSTTSRTFEFYTSDPWTPGTRAYRSVRKVRKIHAAVKKHLAQMSEDELEKKVRLDRPWCPKLDELKQDFRSGCPALAPGRCLYGQLDDAAGVRRLYLSQSDMIVEQITFACLLLLNPKYFGIDYAEADDDLDAFCHVWRCYGYMLGIDDDLNAYRGTLNEVRIRSRDFMQFCVKPDFRELTPKSLHLMRCFVMGTELYLPMVCFDSVILDIAALLGVEMSQIRDSISYYDLLRHYALRFFFNYFSKVCSIRQWANQMLVQAREKVKNFDAVKHAELREMSDRILADYSRDNYI